jgi:hypothetical protein
MIPRPRYQASHAIGGDVGVVTDPTSSTHEHRLLRQPVNAYVLPASFSWGHGVEGSVDRRPDLCFEAVCNYVEEHRHVSAPTFLPASLPAPAQETSREVAVARNRLWCRIEVTSMELRGLTEVGRWFKPL